MLFQDLHAAATTCPVDLKRHGAAQAQCFTADADFRTVRRAVEARLAREGWPLGWTKDRGYRARAVPGASEIFVVLFDPQRQVLAVVPQRPCPVDPSMHTTEEPAPYEAPRRVDFDSPGVSGDGVAILRVVIREDGSVGEPCYLHVQPAREDVKASVTSSVERWRFEPARWNGKPIPTYSLVWVSWTTTQN